MVGMAYAAVPLYRMFCQVTGFGGTTQVAIAPSTKVLDKTIVMRFDANVSDALAWKFEPVKAKFDMKIGENRLANYRATNRLEQDLDRDGDVQRVAGSRRDLLQQDRVLLLHRADAEARRERRHAGELSSSIRLSWTIRIPQTSRS